MLPDIKFSNKAAFINKVENGENRIASLAPTTKKIPRYMQANAAWLAKDKINLSNPAYSQKDPSTNMNKSRGSSLFPTLTNKKKKLK
jgi:hypothetical protein